MHGIQFLHHVYSKSMLLKSLFQFKCTFNSEKLKCQSLTRNIL